MAWRPSGDPETYHGNPCKGCSGTLRYKSSRGCVTCARRRGKYNDAARRARRALLKQTGAVE